MALQIRQALRQTQQLVMTPQLQQAIKLLQYNHLEMVGALEHEIRENPLLEVASHDDPFTDQELNNRQDAKALEDLVKEPERPEPNTLDIDWGNYLETYGGDYTPINRNPDERSPLDNLANTDTNLFSHLLEQLQLSKIEGDDRRIALEIIGNLDDNGYLDIELSQLAELSQSDVEHVEEILRQVQRFDPRGVGARNLRECLKVQVEALEPADETVERILDQTYELFEQGKLDKVARKLKVSLDEVKRAVSVITGLEPKPGRLFTNSDTIYVAPDIYVIKVGNDYTVMLNDDGLPRLRISPFYQKELHAAASAKDAKDYIQDKMRGALWLIKSIHQRQRTIYRVTKSIVKFQRDFFDKGVDYLRPLILRDVAEDIEMHESTISRVTSNKYVHTPRGIFELKYFFSSGLGQGADAVAAESVKNQIDKIIKQENPKKPASDKQIVDLLAADGIHIARRTVAKYREIMGIPPSSKRKKKF